MLGTEIAPRLWRWTAHHPDWKREVASYALETDDDGLVLIDPLVGEEEPPQPAHILITVHWHVRSTRELQERWPDVRVWTVPKRGKPLRARAQVTDTFRPGDPLPGGVEALATARHAEVAYWLPEQRALVVGDVLLGGKDGGVKLCPERWLEGQVTHADLRRSLLPLLELPVQLVLVSHGEPVLDDARAALEAALA